MAHKKLSLGLTGSVAAIALMAATTPAGAQDMSALKAQIDALQKKVDAMEKSAPSDKFIHRGKKQFELEVSGQVNRVVRYANDGKNDQVRHLDNDNSSSRARWVGKGRLNEDVSAGTVIEMQVESNSTTATGIDENAPGSSSGVTFTERKIDLFFDSKRLGRLWMGQGDPASNGTSEYDLSGAGVIALSGTRQLNLGGVHFQDNTTPSPAGPNIASVWSAYDGNTRDDRIRYDTPKFAGFQLGASHIDGDDWDVALKFSGKVGGVQIKAGGAILNLNTSSTVDWQYNGSAAILLPMGLALSVNGGTQDMIAAGREDPWTIYSKLAYRFKGSDLGLSVVAVDIGYNEHHAQNDDETTTYGLYFVQNVDKLSTELFAGVEVWDLDRTGEDFDKIWGIFGGARIKF